jgi:hypothetical protein
LLEGKEAEPRRIQQYVRRRFAAIRQKDKEAASRRQVVSDQWQVISFLKAAVSSP